MIKTGKNGGFTLIELLIVIAIIALLMAILVPALSRAKEMGKRAVCLTHIKQLQLAWNMYCDDNDERIPIGDVYYSWGFPGSMGGPQSSWDELAHVWPHNPIRSPDTSGASAVIMQNLLSGTNAKQADWDHATSEGQLYKYLKDFRIYQCPVGDKDQYVTYRMSHAMNTYPGSAGPGSVALTVKRRNQFKKANERFIFLDAGYIKGGAYFVKYDGGGNTRWYDTPPIRHGMGTNFSFADGSSIYRKWVDKHAIEATKHPWGGVGWAQADDNCDCDLRWFSKATWGQISPTWPACATKKCPD
jgi:prepilin-type N-terminal cleavage/methylation domain-containing protein/prepilin-type processing-associated H-X9-DG protein